MCIFCGGQCGGAVEYFVNFAAIIGAPYCIVLLSRLKMLKHKKKSIPYQSSQNMKTSLKNEKAILC
jgi:hypothetical protein